MRQGGGKNKGSSFEREVGALLSLWLSKGERKDLVCRTVGSGAQFTFSKTCSGNPGDLMANHPEGFRFFSRFVCECKFWRDLKLIQFLNKEGELYKALLKVKEEGASKNKSWILVAKQNHRPAILFTPIETILDIGSLPASLPHHLIFNGSIIMYNFVDFLRIPVECIL